MRLEMESEVLAAGIPYPKESALLVMEIEELLAYLWDMERRLKEAEWRLMDGPVKEGSRQSWTTPRPCA